MRAVCAFWVHVGVSRFPKALFLRSDFCESGHVDGLWERGTLFVRGDLDLASAQKFALVLADSVARAERVLAVDLSAVTFMDSSGLHTLLGAREAADGDGITFRVVASNARVRRLFELCGVDDLLD